MTTEELKEYLKQNLSIKVKVIEPKYWDINISKFEITLLIDGEYIDHDVLDLNDSSVIFMDE